MRLPSLLLLGAIAVASPGQAHDCPPSATDTAPVDRTIRALFDALARDDQAALQRVVTTDFSAFELGKKFTADELFNVIAEAHRSGRVINWSIGPVIVRSNCDLAWAAWENVGSAGVPPNMAPRRWMESAVLRRSPSGWRVEFLHSSQVPPIAPPAVGPTKQ